MSETSSPPLSPRDALLARTVTNRETGCTPVPCPDCPVPGVFAARMDAGRYVEFLEASKPFNTAAGDTPEQAKEKRKKRLAVQVQFAAVDAEGNPLLKSLDEAVRIDVGVSDPLVTLFLTENSLAEKKSATPSGTPAA